MITINQGKKEGLRNYRAVSLIPAPVKMMKALQSIWRTRRGSGTVTKALQRADDTLLNWLPSAMTQISV